MSLGSGVCKEIQQNRIAVVSSDGIIKGDFYCPVWFFSTLSNFSIMKILFKNEKTEG